MSKLTAKLKSFNEKVINKLNNELEAIDCKLANKALLAQSEISNGVYVGKKAMSLDRYKVIARDVKNYGFPYVLRGSVQFSPAHKIFDFKISHHINIYMRYSKKKDATYIWMADEGYFDWSNIFHTDKINGTMYKFKGLVSFEDFVGDDYEDLFGKICTDLYNEKDREMREKCEADEKGEHAYA